MQTPEELPPWEQASQPEKQESRSLLSGFSASVHGIDNSGTGIGLEEEPGDMVGTN